MLVGICLPLWAVNFDFASTPIGPLDYIAMVGAVVGLMTAYVADTQLRNFMIINEQRKAAGQAPVPLLYQGLWRYSRHPNYFGEVVWWTSLALFGVAVGQTWTLVGTIFNTLIMAQVTYLTEKRMLARPERAEAFKAYQKATSVWIPLPPGKLDPRFYRPAELVDNKRK